MGDRFNVQEWRLEQATRMKGVEDNVGSLASTVNDIHGIIKSMDTKLDEHILEDAKGQATIVNKMQAVDNRGWLSMSLAMGVVVTIIALHTSYQFGAITGMASTLLGVILKIKQVI